MLAHPFGDSVLSIPAPLIGWSGRHQALASPHVVVWSGQTLNQSRIDYVLHLGVDSPLKEILTGWWPISPYLSGDVLNQSFNSDKLQSCFEHFLAGYDREQASVNISLILADLPEDLNVKTRVEAILEEYRITGKSPSNSLAILRKKPSRRRDVRFKRAGV